MAGVVDDDQRRVRCEAVEPFERRLGQAVLQKRVPAVEVGAVRAALGHLGTDRGDDVVGPGNRDRPDVDQPVRKRDRLHQRVPVRLDQTGQHTAVADIDHLGVRPDQRLDVGPAADGRDSAIDYCHRLGGGLCVVDRQDCSVDD